MLGTGVHYLGIVGAAARRDHADCDAQWAQIRASHLASGYRDIAYCKGACVHGGRFHGRGWGPNAANGTTWANLNFHSVVALIGTDDPLTDQLLAALAGLIDDAPNGRALVVPHSWFTATSCPGPLHPWVAAGARTATGAPLPIEEDTMFIARGRTVFGVPLGFLCAGGRVLRDLHGEDVTHGLSQEIIDWKAGPGRENVQIHFVDPITIGVLATPWPPAPTLTIPPGAPVDLAQLRELVQAEIRGALNNTRLGVTP